jgi:peptide/nickel transport system permease protein
MRRRQISSKSREFRRARLLRFVARRILYAIPQLVGVSFLTFVIIRLLPANPAVSMLGPYATRAGIARITQQYGLNQSIPHQYVTYMSHVLRGDLGVSWLTSSPVASDLASRAPATLELTSISLLLAALIAIPAGTFIASGRNRVLRRLASGYALIAGALPEFWIGVLLIYLVYVKWRVPGIGAPSGQLDIALIPPPRITGMTALDSLLAGDGADLQSSVEHLILPVTTLVIVLVGPILKQTTSSVNAVMRSDFSWYMAACGYPRRTQLWRALRTAAPAIVTLGTTLYAYLLGGAVLVETIFSWGGAGQYALEAIQHADLMAIQGFVLVAGAFTVIVYLIFDVVMAALDPRTA